MNFSSSYNIAADSLRWSPVNASAGTRLLKDKLAVNLNATLDPYQVNETGLRINKYLKYYLLISNSFVLLFVTFLQESSFLEIVVT